MNEVRWITGGVIVACLTILPAKGIHRFDGLFQDGVSDILYIYIAGCVSGAVLVQILLHAIKRGAKYLLSTDTAGRHDLYRLDHGILNISVPPKSMWMNMGYWEVRLAFLLEV
jgi:hypothetical protein